MELVLKSLQKKTTTAGTAVPLVASKTLAYAVKIKALPTNTGDVYVGQAGVSATNGFALDANDPLDFSAIIGLNAVVDLSKIYVDSGVNAEGVSVSYLDVGSL